MELPPEDIINIEGTLISPASVGKPLLSPKTFLVPPVRTEITREFERNLISSSNQANRGYPGEELMRRRTTMISGERADRISRSTGVLDEEDGEERDRDVDLIKYSNQLLRQSGPDQLV